MSLKVSAADGVKVYSVAGGKSLPHWLSEKKQASLKRDEAYRRRIELIQDLQFPEACQRLKITPDGQFLFATGIHPPRVRVYELAELSLKFERHLDAEIIDFQILTDDYSKAAFLCADRTLCFHARFGAYHKTRVPAYGRDLAYAPFSAELLVVGSSPEVYRLNLSEGRFLSPLQTKSPAVNACGLSPVHGLLACAGETGLLECFDARAKAPVGCFDAAASAGGAGQQLTTVRFDGSGLQCAVGTSGGLVALYDLRMSKPTAVRDHMYGQPIRDIKFHQPASSAGMQGTRVVSADSHSVRIWDASTGQGFATIEPPEPGIMDVLLWPDSGLLMLGCDSPHIQAYFVPALGPAPRWCSFLESLTEELEENAAPTLFDDYRFVTRDEVASLGLGHLVGTPLLRAYMHGYFLHQRLWQRARSLAQPMEPAALRQQRISARLDAERASRITLVKKLPKVNAAVAARLMEDKKGRAGAGAGAGQDGARGLLQDDRFKPMFEDPAFAIDENTEEFRSLHPNARVKRSKLLPQEPTLDPLEDASSGSDADDAGDSDNADGEGPQPRKRTSANGAAEGEAGHRKRPRLYAAGGGARGQHRDSGGRDVLLIDKAEAAALLQPAHGPRKMGGSREMTFVPRGSSSRGGRRGSGRGSGRGGGRGGGRSASRGRSGGRGSRGRH
ncbi:hypothetical protein WJX73_004781 [Symbiochloris irregularis]|uniref:Nucleolar 10 n=1 Tax=Symbiochloris irregularis TaxID=706552 RepID=A0AAW1PN06_9CHLO